MQNILYITLTLLFLSSGVLAQDVWEVPDKEKKSISILMFDEEFEVEGEMIYNSSCKSCHGNPTQEDFSLMLPSPGDVASEKFQNQTDGEMFYRIKTGRGSMPKFEDALDRDEIWYLVAFIRSFNDKYVQPKPNLEGIIIPDIHLKLSFDDNVDKLVVKTMDKDGNPMLDVVVKAYVNSSFGKFLLGKDTCNNLGIAYFDVDSKLPGDENGNLQVIVKASKGYGSAKVNQTMAMVEPVTHVSIIEGRHLWSAANKAPYWLIFTFVSMIIGIWGTIIYIVIGLSKLKKHS